MHRTLTRITDAGGGVRDSGVTFLGSLFLRRLFFRASLRLLSEGLSVFLLRSSFEIFLWLILGGDARARSRRRIALDAIRRRSSLWFRVLGFERARTSWFFLSASALLVREEREKRRSAIGAREAG